MTPEISYNLALSVLTLLVVAWYCGQLSHAFLNPYLTQEGVEASRFITAPVALVAAVTLGVLLMTARGAYNERETNLETVAAKAIQLNRQLYFIPDDLGRPAHNALRVYVDHLITHRPYAVLGDPDKSKSEPVIRAIMDIPTAVTIPHVVNQDIVDGKERALKAFWELSEARMNLAVKAEQAVYSPSVMLVTLWFSLIFFCLGATSPWGNRALMLYGFMAATCVASSIFLLAEWQAPLSGLIQLSDRPLFAIQKSLDNTE